MTEESDEQKPTEGMDPKAKGRLVVKLGRTLWQVDNKDTLKGLAADARKERWQADKQPYVAKARELLRRLPKIGIVLTLTEVAKDDADVSGDDD